MKASLDEHFFPAFDRPDERGLDVEIPPILLERYNKAYENLTDATSEIYAYLETKGLRIGWQGIEERKKR